jgi:hypothetical protein
MYRVSMENQYGYMIPISLEESDVDAYEQCAELVRSGRTARAVAVGVERVNRHHEIEIFGFARSL